MISKIKKFDQHVIQSKQEITQIVKIQLTGVLKFRTLVKTRTGDLLIHEVELRVSQNETRVTHLIFKHDSQQKKIIDTFDSDVQVRHQEIVTN